MENQMSAPIRITVARADGEVTLLEGHSGMAVCCADLSDPKKVSASPLTSFRCYSAAELSWNLAALMAGVRHLNPTAFSVALELMDQLDFENPTAKHRLPPSRE